LKFEELHEMNFRGRSRRRPWAT